MNSPSDDIRRKRLLWRATHRGIKEMDLILGGFVTRHLASFTAEDVAELERIMDIPDQDMLAWATKQVAVPPDVSTPMLARILGYTP